MIGVDTSSFIDFLNNDGVQSVGEVTQAIVDEKLIMPPFVVTELLMLKILRARRGRRFSISAGYRSKRVFGKERAMPELRFCGLGKKRGQLTR